MVRCETSLLSRKGTQKTVAATMLGVGGRTHLFPPTIRMQAYCESLLLRIFCKSLPVGEHLGKRPETARGTLPVLTTRANGQLWSWLH